MKSAFRLCHPKHLAPLVWMAALCLTAGSGFGQVPSKPAAPSTNTAKSAKASASLITLVGERTLVLDAACNACSGATVWLTAQNLATVRSASAKLQLRVEHLVSDPKGDPGNAGMSIEPKDAGRPLPAELKPGESVPFGVRVQGILAAGTWKAALHNGDADLGEVKFIVPEVGFHVSLTGADGKPQAVTVTRGEKASVMLKNEDPVGYRVTWSFRPNAGKATPSQEEKITAGGQTLLGFDPQEEWFEEAGHPVCPWFTSWLEYIRIPCNWRAIFKDKEADGIVTVRLASSQCKDDSGAPTRLLAVHAVLAYYGPNKKSVWSYIGVIALLLAGALVSLYVIYKIRDEHIRSDLKEQLNTTGKAISDLSMTLASRLRVLVGIENRLLSDKLKVLAWYSTEFEKQRAEVADRADRLARRVDLLRKMGRLREDYVQLSANEVPPTLLAKLEEWFEQLGRMIDDFQLSDTDLQDAELKLKQLQQAIVNWRQPDNATTGELIGLLQSLSDDLQGVQIPPPPSAPAPVAAPVVAPPPGAPAPAAVPPAPAPPAGAMLRSKTLTLLLAWRPEPTPVLAPGARAVYEAAYPAIRDLFEELTQPVPTPAQISGAVYYRKGLAAYRGDTLRRYVSLCDTQNPDGSSPLVQRRDDLVGLLVTESWYAQRKARRLVWEMSEGVYQEDVKKEIEAKRLEIRLDRNLVRAYEPALFHVRFLSAKFDTCSALEEWHCILNFGHGPFEGKNDDPSSFLEEEGWSVAHYFPGKDRYTLKAHFRHDDGGAPCSPKSTIDKDVFVGRRLDDGGTTGARDWIRRRTTNVNAILRLVLALVPAVLGLVSGAKDEFLKMDLFLALSGVFLLGFGSDQVKNLLTQKPKA